MCPLPAASRWRLLTVVVLLVIHLFESTHRAKEFWWGWVLSVIGGVAIRALFCGSTARLPWIASLVSVVCSLYSLAAALTRNEGLSLEFLPWPSPSIVDEFREEQHHLFIILSGLFGYYVTSSYRCSIVLWGMYVAWMELLFYVPNTWSAWVPLGVLRLPSGISFSDVGLVFALCLAFVGARILRYVFVWLWRQLPSGDEEDDDNASSPSFIFPAAGAILLYNTFLDKWYQWHRDNHYVWVWAQYPTIIPVQWKLCSFRVVLAYALILLILLQLLWALWTRENRALHVVVSLFAAYITANWANAVSFLVADYENTQLHKIACLSFFVTVHTAFSYGNIFLADDLTHNEVFHTETSGVIDAEEEEDIREREPGQPFYPNLSSCEPIRADGFEAERMANTREELKRLHSSPAFQCYMRRKRWNARLWLIFYAWISCITLGGGGWWLVNIYSGSTTFAKPLYVLLHASSTIQIAAPLHTRTLLFRHADLDFSVEFPNSSPVTVYFDKPGPYVLDGEESSQLRVSLFVVSAPSEVPYVFNPLLQEIMYAALYVKEHQYTSLARHMVDTTLRSTQYQQWAAASRVKQLLPTDWLSTAVDHVTHTPAPTRRERVQQIDMQTTLSVDSSASSSEIKVKWTFVEYWSCSKTFGCSGTEWQFDRVEGKIRFERICQQHIWKPDDAFDMSRVSDC